MQSVGIRPFEPRNRPSVLQMLAALQDHEVQLHDTRVPGRAMAEPYFERLLVDVRERAGALFVAEADGATIGFIACFVVEDEFVAETPDSNRRGYICDIFVAAPWRGRGIAQQLMATAERHLAATGVTRLRINVQAKQRPGAPRL